jgi:Tol biopolymer transport system component
MSGIAVGGGGVLAPSTVTDKGDRTDRWFAWINLLFAAWIIVGLAIVNWALVEGLTTDPGASPYHIPGYLGLVALALFCAVRVVQAARAGRSWKSAFPSGYGVLAGGAVVLVAYVVVDIGWREGVGIASGRSIEQTFAPSRLLLVVGLLLMSMGPLRAAVKASTRRSDRWAAASSAGLVLGILWFPGGFHPAVNPWLERAPDAREDDTEVWMMAPDGSMQTRLVEAGPDYEVGSAPSLSPDGGRMAYTLWRHGDAGSVDADIWLADANGENAMPLVEGTGWQWIPHWSPDGQWIVYTDEAPGGPGMQAAPAPPAEGQGPMGPGFELGPQSLRQFADLWMVKSDGTGTTVRLTETPGDDRAASWSPDGRMLVFDSTRDGNTELYVMNADGTGARRLTDDPHEDWGQTWSPDGTQIAFNSDRTGHMQIYTIRPDGSNLTRLTHDTIESVTPAWSPDSRSIAYARRGDDEEIWVVSSDGSDPRNLSNSPASNDSVWDGAWARNGRILYTRAGTSPATSSPLVRDELGSAGMLIAATMLGVVAALVALTGPPFGAFAVVVGIGTLLAASSAGDWRFLLPAIVGGLIVDVAVRLSPQRRRVAVAATVAAATFVLGAGVAVLSTNSLGWSSSLFLGVVCAAAALGWACGSLLTWRRGNAGPSDV